MRMKLYFVRIERPDGVARVYIVALSEDQAAELVIDHELELGLPSPAFSIERVDETLAENRRLGLDSLLENAPVGFASFTSVGWISHVAEVQRLRMFRIEDDKGEEVFIIAPSRDAAVVIYCAEYRVGESEQRQFRISDGLIGLPADRIRNLSRLLEFGPAGEIVYKPEYGWQSY